MQKDTKAFTAVLSHTERLNNSANGNPRYRLFLVGGSTVETAPDASINYGITNSEFYGVPVHFETDTRGRVIHAQPQPK